MTNLKFIVLAIVAACCLCTTSCIEDGISSSSTDLLEFSCDTVDFDTIFSELGTPTKQFVVYNRHKKIVRISSIELDGSLKGKFFLNVDGMKGESFHNVEVRGEDSIYVFVECFANPTGQDTPLEIIDHINFTTNGVSQKVVLSAWSQDVIRLTDAEIASDTHFTANKPYVIFGNLHVAEGTTLTIDAGATVYFHDKAGMTIDGTLIAAGSQQQPINLRGDRTDYLFQGANYDIMSGQWDGIAFTDKSYGNEFNYVLMRGSSNGVSITSSTTDRRALHLFNSVLHNSSDKVFSAQGSWVDAEGCEFTDAASNVVSLTGGKYHFTQCTFANYYLFSIASGAIINIDMKSAEGDALNPEVTIDNSIICGNAAELSQSDFSGHNVLIRNCMLASKGSDDSNFISCKWGGDAKFFVDRQKYVFDYRLHNQSDAIAGGDTSLCPASANIDRYGNTRLRDGAIDLGAYTWIYSEENQ